MGPNVLTKDLETSLPTVGAEPYPRLAHRFQACFRPLFAYVYSCVGDSEVTVELVAEAFARSYKEGQPSPGDNEFRFRLFQVARRLCRPYLQRRPKDNGALSPRELEVLALIFDGQLTRREVGRLLRLKQEQIAMTTFVALKKLHQEQVADCATAQG